VSLAKSPERVVALVSLISPNGVTREVLARDTTLADTEIDPAIAALTRAGVIVENRGILLPSPASAALDGLDLIGV
jgi:hypothetical protein